MTTPDDGQAASSARLLESLHGRAWLRSAWRALPRPLRDAALRLLTIRLRARTAFPRTAAWRRWKAPGPAALHVQGAALDAAGGVNILGYIHGQFGLAEAARMYARALIENGVPVALADIDLALPHGWNDDSLSSYLDPTLPHPVCIIFVNPDYLEQALASIGKARLHGRHIIACWFWELESIPASWLPALDLVDEILVATGFVEQAVSRVTDKPVLKVPMPLSGIGDSGLQRVDFGLDEDAFVFLFSFDFSSRMERKNPLGVIAAFRAAFPPERSDVQLLLKTSNGYRYPHWLKIVLDAAAGDPRILVRDAIIDREHLAAMQRCCDAYVSLHRAEGFGMGLAECMAHGRPVIATGWSGNMEFMDADSAALVDYRMVGLTDAEYPGGQGQRWAEPDIAHAARWMRSLADDRDLAARLGTRGQHAVTTTLSPRRAAEAVVARLGELRSQRAATSGSSAVPAVKGTP